MRYTGIFSVSWVEDEDPAGKPAGQLDGSIEVETHPLKSWTVVGHADEQMTEFCMKWSTGGGEARELQITDVESGKTWQGMFLPGEASITFGDQGDGSVVLESTGEIKET